jgi:hypothetical protein
MDDALNKGMIIHNNNSVHFRISRKTSCLIRKDLYYISVRKLC